MCSRGCASKVVVALSGVCPFSGTAEAGAVCPLAEAAKLTASDPATEDRFGTSVAVDGDTAVMGAPLDDDAGFICGSAYVFARSGGVWSQQAKLLASDAASYGLFGVSVAVDGDTAVVGAYGDNGYTGAAYVFVRSGGSWAQQAKLTASDAAEADRFGRSVAIDGDTVVGASDNDDACPSDPACNSGSAYVFVRSGSVWSQEAKLTASDGAMGDAFGNSAAVSGQTAVVGAEGDDVTWPDAGSAYVFVRSAGVWTEQGVLNAADGASGDFFGVSAGVAGDLAVVGAASDDDAGNQSGSAYVFVRHGTVWSERAKVTSSDGVSGDDLGLSVAMDGETAVLGAPRDDDPCPAVQNCNTGSVYVIDRSGPDDLRGRSGRRRGRGPL